MKLLENIDCKKGITLNIQLVDLLLILDDNSLTVEQQNQKIENYINELRNRQDRYNEASSKGAFEKYQFLLEDVISSISGLSPEHSERLKDIYLSNIADLSVCNAQKMIQILTENGFDSSFHKKIMSGLQTIQYTAKEGILLLTPDKVRALYGHLFDGGNRYDRVTFDNVGKYSGYVSADGETYATENIDKMQAFCEMHGMQSKINALMFYCDFPKVYEQALENRVLSGEITAEDKKLLIQQALFDYVRNIGQRYGDRIDTVDVLNELIYDPNMKEDGFDEATDEYKYRTQGWHEYLSLEDICKMVLIARKTMPNVNFTYNDMNWTKPEKREQIIRLLQQIHFIEDKFRTEGIEIDGELVKLGENETIIDTIGFEAHLTTDVDLGEMDKAFEEVAKEIGLPIEITELDVACMGENLEQEQKKQGKIFEKIMQMIQAHPEIRALTIWSQSDECSFMNTKNPTGEWRNVSASLLDSNFQEKSFELTQEIGLQSFNYHTHTELCGHADGTMQEYIEKAIEGGITTLGFSDHVPNPFGKSNPHHEMSSEQFFSEYIPNLKRLREEYSDRIDIQIGLESEYFGITGEQHPIIKDFREATEGYLDYMILGQHSALARDEQGQLIMPPQMSSKSSSKYPLDYALAVVEAIKSGKFAYVAHPDIFLEGRDSVLEEEREEYLQNAKTASQMICEVASQYRVPLEVNLGSISAVEAGIKSKMQDGSYAYPVPEFWRIAQEKGCQVLIGIDAHSPVALLKRDNELTVKKFLKDKGIELDYLDTFTPLGIGKENSRMTRQLKSGLEDCLQDSELTTSQEQLATTATREEVITKSTKENEQIQEQ